MIREWNPGPFVNRSERVKIRKATMEILKRYGMDEIFSHGISGKQLNFPGAVKQMCVEMFIRPFAFDDHDQDIVRAAQLILDHIGFLEDDDV